jgi:TRAP-type C4-dicarboxylate transport system permease small subunit
MANRSKAATAYDRLATVQKVITVGAFATCLGFIVAEVILRNVVRISLFGTSEIAILSAWWFYMFGASLGAWERTHIKADILLVFVKRNERGRAIVRTVSSVLTVFLSIVVTSWACIYIDRSFELHRTSSYLRIPMIYAQMPILIGLGLMTFYFVLQLVDNVLQLTGKRPVEAYDEGAP